MSPNMIHEINASKKSFIKDTPQYHNNEFISQQQKRFSNRKSNGAHPFSQQPSQTFFEDPLVSGSTQHFNTFLEFNNRSVSSSVKHKAHGGALMYEQPKGGDLESDSDGESSEGEYSSEDEEFGGAMHHKHHAHAHLHKLSKKQLQQMAMGGKCDEGAGLYSDYIKPAGKFVGNTLYSIGKEVFKEVVVPVAKEAVKKAVVGAVTGGSEKKRGRPKGSKNKPKQAPVEDKKAHAISAVEALVKKVEEPVLDIMPLGKKERKPRAKKVKNLEEEKNRVEHEIAFEEGKKMGEKKKRVASDRVKKRAEIVKKVMKEHGLKLGPASKYVKEHGLA